jgi:hypothetical protein
MEIKCSKYKNYYRLFYLKTTSVLERIPKHVHINLFRRRSIMYTRLIYLICFILVLGMVGNVQAKDTQFRNADPGDSLWSTEGNWDNGLPAPGDWAKIRGGPPGATIASDVGEVLKIAIGYDEGSALTVVDGGSLTTEQDVVLGRNGDGTLNMMGGIIDCRRDFELGYNNPAVLNMTGGTIIVGRDVELPKEGNGQTTHVDLHGGTLIVNDDLLMGEGGTMDITAGTLIIDANVVSTVQEYIDDGWITAYGGDGTVQLDYDVTNKGKTTVKGVHKLKPNPIDGGLAAPGTLELSWTLPDPCVPGQLVLVDVYFTDNWAALYSFTDPAAIQVVSNQNVTSIVVQTQPKTRYYWAVDTYIGDPNDPILGPIFSFLADNQAPQVDAGPDLLTWLGEDGTRAKNLDATVTDNDAYTVQWTVVSEPDDPNNPDAVIADASAEDTSITVSAVGEYVLQLEASDGEKTGSDTVTISVYSDGCEAAKSLPDYEPYLGDLNGDCKVDDLDLAILEEDWLKDNSLTEP